MTRISRDKYAEYIQSEDWLRKREKVLARDKHRCTRCRGIENLHVHHLTYDNLGHERLADLTTLCDLCHEVEHKAGGEEPK